MGCLAVFPEKWQLSRDLNTVRERDLQISETRIPDKGTARAEGREREVGARGQVTQPWKSLWQWVGVVHGCIRILKGIHWLLFRKQAKGWVWKKEHHTGGSCSHQRQKWEEQGRNHQAIGFWMCRVDRANKICWWQTWRADVGCESNRDGNDPGVCALSQMVGPLTQMSRFGKEPIKEFCFGRVKSMGRSCRRCVVLLVLLCFVLTSRCGSVLCSSVPIGDSDTTVGKAMDPRLALTAQMAGELRSHFLVG